MPKREDVATASRRQAAQSGAREDTTHAGLMAALADARRTGALFAKLAFMARTRYGLSSNDAEDAFHEAVATYLSIHGRYPPADNHFGILVGIFQRKVLEHLGHRERDGRIARRFVARLRADQPLLARGEDPEGPAADRVVRSEDAELIRNAIGALSPEGRELLLTLAEGRATRLELIEELGVNRNTFDTRLRALRLRLRDVLTEAGVL